MRKVTWLPPLYPVTFVYSNSLSLWDHIALSVTQIVAWLIFVSWKKVYIFQATSQIKNKTKKPKKLIKTKPSISGICGLTSYPVESSKTEIWETLLYTIVLFRKKFRNTKQPAQFHVASELQNASGYWNQQISSFHQKLLYPF